MPGVVQRFRLGPVEADPRPVDLKWTEADLKRSAFRIAFAISLISPPAKRPDWHGFCSLRVNSCQEVGVSHSVVIRGSLCAALSVLAVSLSGCSMTLALDPSKNAAQTPQTSDSAVVALRKMVNMEDPQVRALAARELGAMGEAGREGVPTLYGLVDDPDRAVRLEAARAVTRINGDDPVAVPALVMIAKDPLSTPEDRREAIATLQQMGPRGQEAATNLALAEAQAVYRGGAPSTRPSEQPLKASANVSDNPPRENGIDRPVRNGDAIQGDAIQGDPIQ